MSNRGRGLKRSRWGGKMGRAGGWGSNGRWRTNYRGWLGGTNSWAGNWRTNYRGSLGSGDSVGGSVWNGAGERFGNASYGGRGFRTGMHGAMDPGAGLSSLSDAYPPRQTGTGGILSSFQPSFGGGRAKLKKLSIAELDPEVRERFEERVSALLLRYAQVFYNATGDDVQPVTDKLLDLLGPKYARLAFDWVHQQARPPGLDDTARFVVWVVEAAAVDGGREPLSWKIQRAISGLLDRLFGGQGEQEKEIQSQAPVGAIPAET